VSRGVIEILVKSSIKDNNISNKKKRYQFICDGILHKASQETVYNTCGRILVNSAFEGHNG
jgi:hypothetical protein